ncbi:interleukin-2 receptor subunit beta [Lates japonicus]
MSHIVVMAVVMLWPSYVLVVLFLVPAAHCQEESQGLYCVNDFVNNVSCTWNSTAVAPGVDCWIYGAKETWTYEGNKRVYIIITRGCKLKQHRTSPPGCSFVFDKEEFNCYDVMPNISVKCNGELLESLENYEPGFHIKMNPPGNPNVSITANETLISWSPGSSVSDFFASFDFQVELNQTWREVSILSLQEQQLPIPSWQLQGHCQVRVRVKPSDESTCGRSTHWSNWSPTTSWRAGKVEATTSRDQDWFLDQTSLAVWVVMLSFSLFVLLLIFYMSCAIKGRLKLKPVPNPSKYFPTLHSVHGGSLKKWLNPASESFFTAQPCDHISPVEVCESWDVVLSSSPSSSSTSALLNFRSYPSVGSDTSGIVNNSSSSSGFSNIGYFMSSSSSSIPQTDPAPAYFTYQDDFHIPHNGHNLHLSLCPSFTSSRAYESLKREPQSPDSGFGIGQEEEDRQYEEGMDVEGEEVSDDHQNSPLLILPLHLPSWVCPPSSAPLPPHPPTQICSDSQEVDDAPVAAACGSYAAWPVAGAMCRSSSMPVEPSKTGYLTLKELQTHLFKWIYC